MKLNAQDKVRLFRELTRGASDVFAAHMLGKYEGESRWRPVFSSLRDDTVLLHLKGSFEIGSYPLIPHDPWPLCYWICADFDGKHSMSNWQADVKNVVQFLLDFDGCPVFVNLSRSGQGAHVRMLFREAVPAWLARRWFSAWLEEAGIDETGGDEWDDEVPTSFDRLIPPQDVLKQGYNQWGQRSPGNLAGSPLHGGHARSHGGTLPLDPHEVARGNFEPDGRHWQHVVTALESRGWGETELRAALKDCPEPMSDAPPQYIWTAGGPRRALPVIPGGTRELEYAVVFCEFFEHMQRPGTQSYPLWVAMASQLHRFGEEGKRVFHEISSHDSRYVPGDTEMKWRQTADMLPVRCDTLAKLGWRCPHLDTPRCNGARAPAYFAEHTDAEIL